MFIELHAQSAFSFLEAAEQPETLAEAAARLDMPALALVDRDGIYGAPRFYRAMTRLGLRAIVGSEITLADGARLPLLVEDQEGYQNLCRLITTVKLGGREAAATLDDVEAHASGLVCLTGTAAHHVDRLAAIFGVSGCFVEIQRHLDREEERVSQERIAMAERRRLPLIATNQPRHCRPGGRALTDVLTCIREKTDLDHAGRLLARNAERSLKPALMMRRLFADRPDAIVNTAELATRLNFSMKDLGYRFPDYPVPAGETPLSYLRALAEQGCRDRYGAGPLAPRARAQIAHELELIGRLDLAGYFLIVWDIVQYCRQHDILVQGRGSAANSAVCYCLGITAVDSVKMDLLFERFLSEARGEWPDIDLDLPSGDRREEVIQHVYRRYGVRGAGMTANVITYRGRLAAREVGKALGLPPDLRDRIAKLVPNWGYQDPDDLLLKHLDAAGCDSRHPRVRKFAALWGMIQDLPRHLGQHSGGMVICGGRLDEVVPLEPATMPGRVVVQWDKDDCAALGIVKVDLLGLGMMALLQDAITLVRDGGDDIDLGALPADDPVVYAGLQQADTVGLFQVESRAQMATLPRIHPERFYDLVVQVAIIRPGPIVGNMVHPYINRRRGREAVTYPHPSLEPILKRTLGVPLFQEQLLRMAMAAAGFTASEAEELRRAFGFKRSEARMVEVEVKLRAGMAKQGITGAAADEIAKSITSFALYGFPECVLGDTLVIDADTGRRVKIEDIASGATAVEHTIACDPELHLRRRRVLKATASGRRMVYRVRTALGRTVTATAEHPLMTLEGWRPVAALRAGDHVAVARRLPRLGGARWPRHEIIVLGDLIAEGNLCHPSTVYFYTTDPEQCREFVEAVEQFENTRATIARHRSCYSVHVRRLDRTRPAAVIEWAKRLGLWGIGAREKRLPEEVFELREDDVALLLGRLWQGDGTVSAAGHVTYDTASEQLAEDVQHLLLRLGIVSRVGRRTHAYRGRRVPSFTVTVTGRRNLRRFSLLIARRFLDERKRAAVQAVVARSRSGGRMSRDVVPAGVSAAIDHQRRVGGVTWRDLGRDARLAIRELSSPSLTKRGYRRWVIGRLARYFDSPELSRLARSHLYWDRITSVDPVGERQTYDLHIEGDHNFLANDVVVHNSHATSFALLAYASAYLRTHHPAAFYAAILNNQPMGFYHPATLVKDGQRHGVHFRAVDVTRSDWPCTIERDSGAVRLGLRYVKGLRESAGRAIVSARAEAPFSSVDDLVRRAGLDRDEAEALARIGALASLGFTRRAALWETARAVRPAGPLYEPLEGAGRAPEPSPLREMTRLERLTADYAGTGVTLGAHPMALRRAALSRLGVARATDLGARQDGDDVLVAGSVIVRQRPGTAKGFVFLSLEDETGIANVIVRPPLFDRHRLVLVTEPFLLIRGTLQQQDGVTSVRAEHVAPLPGLDAVVPSHDFG